MPLPVLAFDTSTSACSACVWRDGQVLAHRFESMARGQSETLMPMIEAVMAEAGLAFADLGLIGVTVGPGAFTGLRIGLAAARAIALAAGLPVAGVTTTAAAAHAVPLAERHGRIVLAAIESKRAEVYVQAFGPALAPLGEILLVPPEQAAAGLEGELLLTGCAARRVADVLGAPVSRVAGPPDAAVVAVLAARAFAEGSALPPSPLYLRPPDVTMP